MTGRFLSKAGSLGGEDEPASVQGTPQKVEGGEQTETGWLRLKAAQLDSAWNCRQIGKCAGDVCPSGGKLMLFFTRKKNE